MYHYTESGLPNVFLRGGYAVHDTEYGEGVSIHDLAGLHKAIGQNILHKSPALTGDEVRFLRKEMDLTQNSLSGILKVSEDTLRGWENGRVGISPPADSLLRIIYQAKVNGNSNVCDLLEDISRIDREMAECEREMNFDESEGAWQEAA